MREFTTNRDPILFKIDDDTFMGVPDIPAGKMLDLLKMQQDMTTTGDTARQFDIVLELFRMLLVREAYAKFERRLNDPDNPIGMRTLVEVVQWLLGEAYGLRPTLPSPSSQEQSAGPTTGPPSTAGALREESTPEGSLGPGS